MVALLNGGLRDKIPSSRTRIFSRVSPCDLAWAGVSAFLAFIVRDGGINRFDIVAIYCLVALITSLIAFQWFKISTPIANYFSVNDAFSIIKACLTTAALTTVVMFSFTRLEDAPRSVPLIHFLLHASGLICARAANRMLETRRLHGGSRSQCADIENILIVGATRMAWFFSKMIEELAPTESRVVAILDERRAFRDRTLNGYSIVGSPVNLSRIIDEYATHGIEIRKVVIAVRQAELSAATWTQVRNACEARNVTIGWLNEQFSLLCLPAVTAPGLAASDMESAVTSARWAHWETKRVMDFLAALAMLITVSPLVTLVAILALFDVGYPVVFWQQRIGFLGRPLYVYKFRTMRNSFDPSGQPTAHSERTSMLGRLLRRSRLDELPQLFNVLAGGMSLIGPRPLLPIDQPKNMRARTQIRPGLTGLAQINGGTLLSPDEKDALDEWYIQHASFWLDIKILVRTIWVAVRGDRRNEREISAALAEKRAETESDVVLHTKTREKLRS